MKIIYEPSGRAREYSALACNLYMGCSHWCRYCFAPAAARKSPEEWHSNVPLRANALENLEADAKALSGDSRPIFFSFLSDPYQPLERECGLTRQALEIIQRHGLKSQILTKGAASLISRDLELMREIKTQFGVTVCFVDDEKRAKWEPHASPVSDRFEILEKAHRAGVSTWVSLEPVIDPEQALAVIEKAAPFVDYWKVGKLNHMKAVEKTVNWRKFGIDAESLLKKLGAHYYIKQDLRNKMC